MLPELIQIMKAVQATAFSLYLKAHNFHWNVVGPNFSEYHEFFGEYYDTVWNSVDDFAEHTRTLGSFVPGSLSRFSELTRISDENSLLSADQMFSQLYADNAAFIELLNETHELAVSNKKYGIVNFLEDRIDWHNKMHWMLGAFLSKLNNTLEQE